MPSCPRFLAVSALLAALALSASCSREGGPSPATQAGGGPAPAAVEVVTVALQPMLDSVDLVGQLESDESVEIRPELDGVIESVEFTEGQEVKKGAVLFRLRDAVQRARLHEAEANAALAEDVFRRTSQLAKQNVAAASQLDRARADLDAARARVEVARVEIDRTQVCAPFDGMLGVRQVSPGDRVTTSTSLVQIDAVARLRLAIVIPEIAVPIARVGAKVNLTTAPFPGEVFRGEVFFVAPTLDPATRRLQLKAWVPNPDRRLRPGLFANLKLNLGERSDVLLVPEEAVVYDRQGTYVWRVGEGNLAERVTVGTHKVTQGAPVRPAGPTLAEPPSGAAGPAPVGGGR
jgi:membrane fusion protein (multidrug efflux system)